jgi:curved DNA-binding protein CbpA
VAPDHYATLGLSPTSEDVVIRAAYRALIRRYHPDRNASTTAAARARAINAAYAVLSDPDSRAEYDELRAAEAWPNVPLRRRRRAVPSGLFAAASVAVLIALVLLVIWLPLPMVKPSEHVAQVPASAPKSAEEIPVLPRVEETDEQAAVPDPTEPEVANPQLDEPLTAPPPLLAAPKPRVAPQPRTVQPKLAQSAPAQLANLDRQQALLFNQSWLNADTAKRAQLLRTRDRFIARRDGCRSNSCTSAIYLARLREVSEIMIGRSLPDRQAP